MKKCKNCKKKILTNTFFCSDKCLKEYMSKIPEHSTDEIFYDRPNNKPCNC